ncbi:MAG: FprA family A-type flavoprotein [Oscillospiraceae bacterium]|nr:FprA family A-type flavoprotein [Oscillospiraceae bacterium]
MSLHLDPAILPVGCFDNDIDLFESQYAVPNGVSYNSYLILDEKTAVLDTVDPRKTQEWLANLDEALAGRAPDYLVIHHMEPDHAGSVAALADRFPGLTLVGNAKTFPMLSAFTGRSFQDRALTVKEGDVLELGAHKLSFLMAPMVHWPEVMVSYESASKTLFSADGFGRFGDTAPDSPWVDEARRYYINIVGKYGAQVQALLKKAAALDIQTVCPLHGPILSGEALALALEKYGVWSSYAPEEKGVLVAYASIHGNTARAALELADMLRAQGLAAEAIDLTRRDWAEAVAGAFRYSGLVLAAASYDAGVFPPMAQLLARLKSKGFKDRVVGLMENGSWGPTALRAMLCELEGMKGLTILEPRISIKAAATDADRENMRALARAMAEAL